jgi:hypothetical protein
MGRIKSMLLAAALVLGGYLVPIKADHSENTRVTAERPAKVDLWKWQSPVKDQGARGTCIAHSSVAALEAAYQRAGHGDLDLSEEFTIFCLKMFWLEPNATTQPFAAENKPGFLSGGFGQGYIHAMANGFGVPEEKAMRYRGRDSREPQQNQTLPAAWQFQYEVGQYNLNPKRFDPVALSQATFYGVKSYQNISGKDTDQLEAALAAGREVVWDFDVPESLMLPGRPAPTEWVVDPKKTSNKGGHSVLIVGYDRIDPNNPAFLIKNSWAGAQKVRASYEFVRRFGLDGTVVMGVTEPRNWSELAGLGRWYLKIDGRKGVLDLYHVPGMARTNFDRFGLRGVDGEVLGDHRIGTFFLDGDPLKAYRVNGSLAKDGVSVQIDWSNPNLPYSGEAKATKLSFGESDKSAMEGKNARAVRLSSRAAFGRRVALTELPEVEALE